MPDQAPHRLVEGLEGRIRPLEIEFHRAYWDSQVAATEENERRRADLELELRRAKGNPDDLRAVEQALGEDLHEPLLRRQLEVLRLSLLGNQMDEERRVELVELSSAVESDFAAHRPLLNGKRITDNDIEEVLTTSQDEEARRTAWMASKEVGAAVASRVRELARLRNAAAVELGFPDYYAMALELQEIPESWLFKTLAELESLTDEPFSDWKAELDARLRRRFGTSALMPWHYADPFFQKLPPDGRRSLDGELADRSARDLAQSTFSGWGIDLTGVMDASDLYPRERKSQHAFCLDVDRTGKDVRILANVVPGERWIEVLLHESGHAAYDIAIDRHVPYLLHRPAHTFVTEGMAIFSGRMARRSEWLTSVAGIDTSAAAPMANDLRRADVSQSLLFSRWVLVVTHFERELYRDPESDLDSRWWELVQRFQLVEPPPGRSAPDWAAKIHVATAPAYYHNYLLGEMLASRLEQICLENCGALIGEPAVGELLSERLFRSGASLRWDYAVERATGGPLSAGHFVAGLTA